MIEENHFLIDRTVELLLIFKKKIVRQMFQMKRWQLKT
jgi:hypothetical protein